ncbi:MAG TPA: alpha-amylase family glycosyl hydrolase [Candidatus Methylacidiphilales bacterium]|nr:alpha-amylase family glycosyl hydrolase [Candidatus Methylacidiphilales bacterium]
MQRPTPSWLSSAIFYEIYPQSFRDTNGDGIGDLPGVIEKLDYIQSLGCDAIWLNPCFESPFRDAGYDISDFYKVAARYGTNADLVRLFREAHTRGMKVCLDLVAGHTSTDHPWFQASARPEKNKYSNWFIWTDNGWREPGAPLTGIKGEYDRDGVFVVNFFAHQPALNYGFANPDPAKPWQLPVTHPDVKAVRREMMKIMRFWLDQGADGFRVDMAASLVKGDTDFRETMAFWREVRAVYDRDYPEAVLIAEWSNPALAITAGFHIDFMIHFNGPAYTTLFRDEAWRDVFRGIPAGHKGRSFFDRSGRGDIRRFLDLYLEHYEPTRKLGFISVPTGNHDLGRLAQGRTMAELEVAFAFLMTQPGVPYIYMGDEIGMRQIEGLPSKEGGFGRTGARTPMQWDATKNAGFSKAAASKLYLPIDPASDRPTVARQEREKKSLLNHVRRLAKLRKTIPALGGGGDFAPVYAKAGRFPFAYTRSAQGRTVLVAVNPSGKRVKVTFDAGKLTENTKALLARGAKLSVRKGRATLEMAAVSWGIFG